MNDNHSKYESCGHKLSISWPRDNNACACIHHVEAMRLLFHGHNIAMRDHTLLFFLSMSPGVLRTHMYFQLARTFKVLRRARTRCSLSFSRGSLALWVKQRRSSCRLQGLGSPRAVMLACSKALYSCSSPSRDSGSRPSDGRRSLPSETLLSRLSTLNSRMSGRPTGADE